MFVVWSHSPDKSGVAAINRALRLVGSYRSIWSITRFNGEYRLFLHTGGVSVTIQQSGEKSVDAYEAIQRLGAAPLWRYQRNLFSAQPKSKAVPYVWRYNELRPYLLHFSTTLSLKEAER